MGIYMGFTHYTTKMFRNRMFPLCKVYVEQILHVILTCCCTLNFTSGLTDNFLAFKISICKTVYVKKM